MEKNTMIPDKTAVIRRHVEAVTAMLLGNRRLTPTIAITGGDPLGIEGLAHLSQIARTANTDVVHLAFADVADGYCMTDISIIMPRDCICYVQTGCRLWLSKAGARAIILPQAEGRGMFRLSPGEILHVDRKPVDVDAGIKRAEARLRSLIGRGVCVEGQIEISELPSAA